MTPRGTPATYADPQTYRFHYEEITSSRGYSTDRSLNPVCKELYLVDEDFFAIFGMSKKEFYGLKLWKQRELKKKVGLW